MNMNEDRSLLPAAKMQPTDSYFWQYKVYVDIHRDFLDR